MQWSDRRWRRLAVWVAAFALLAASAGVFAGVPDTLQQRIKACTSCHGKHGQGGTNHFIPRLAGKPELYLYHQLRNFQRGRRRYPLMQHMVKGLPHAYLREIAHYFASKYPVWPTPKPSKLPTALLHKARDVVEHGDPARKIPACMACHGKRLTGLEPAIPPLLGLPKNYIRNQMGAWRGGQRHAAAPDCMAKVAKRLTPQLITAISAWLAAQPAPKNLAPLPAGSIQKLPLKCGSMRQ